MLLLNPSLVLADGIIDMDNKTLTKEDVISALSKQQTVLTRGIALKQQQPGISMRVQFGFDSINLSEHSKSNLSIVAEALNSNRLASDHVRIEGHTDAVGTSCGLVNAVINFYTRLAFPGPGLCGAKSGMTREVLLLDVA